MIHNLLQERGIDKKIFTITLDNASTNDRCVELLKQKLNIKRALFCEGEFFHLHCYAYILVTPLKLASANPVESLAIHPVEPTYDQMGNHPYKNVRLNTKEGE
jgi:hypothetical protein